MLSSDLALRCRSARTDPALAVLEGFHAVKHAIRFGAEIEVLVARDRSDVRAMARRLAPDILAALDAGLADVSPEQFADLSPTPPDTGVIAVARRRRYSDAALGALPPTAPIVLLEAPAHAGNIGAAIRVAAGAGAGAVITTGPNDPWQPAAIRGSAGLHYALPVARTDRADFAGRRLVAIDPDGAPLDHDAIRPGDVLAFGSERSGLSDGLRARADATLRIPMQPGVSSLNLATAVAVVLYRWRLGPR